MICCIVFVVVQEMEVHKQMTKVSEGPQLRAGHAHCFGFTAHNLTVLVQFHHSHQPYFQQQHTVVSSEKALINLLYTTCSAAKSRRTQSETSW